MLPFSQLTAGLNAATTYGTRQCANTGRVPDHTHLLKKGAEMAVSKSTRRSPTSTRQQILRMFGSNHHSEQRAREWFEATAHLESGEPLLMRYPIYAHLHDLNLHAQRTVDALGEIGKALNSEFDSTTYCQAMVQYARSLATSDVFDRMLGVEETEAWIFGTIRGEEEAKLRDPDDIYIHVRRRETERIAQGMPPRIRFLTEKEIAPKPTKKAAKTAAKSAKAKAKN